MEYAKIERAVEPTGRILAYTFELPKESVLLATDYSYRIQALN